ncbi:MAG: glucose-1-phosphate adenylyltransferase [Alkaliphilus sp.]
MLKKECIAMLLAGGQGSRLGVITKKLAKPAVPFGGKYRIIDFTLSNCSHSGIDTVGVMTQYKPLVLNSYIGVGSHWDLNRKNGGVTVLPPYVRESGGEWYKGTANAVYQNIEFIEQYNPENVLIVSGDHIYKMDYSHMLEFHKDKGADLTIAVIEVPWEEACRFGIMNTNDDGCIEEFDEKPQNPKNNLASMGVYIFKWDVLKEQLQRDEQEVTSQHDFGINIIPRMLYEKKELWAYPFEGYWKDVGTVDSLWRANMDLLEETPKLDLYDDRWRIYSVNPTKPPQYIATTAVVRNALIDEGCQVYGEVERTVLFPGVIVKRNAKILDSVIHANAQIGQNVSIQKSIIGEETIIEDGCIIGESGEDKQVTVITGAIIIPSGTVVENGTILSLENCSEYNCIAVNK